MRPRGVVSVCGGSAQVWLRLLLLPLFPER